MPTTIDDVKLAQGPAKLATAEDLEKDAEGITKPNLHRRIDDDLSELEPGEVAKDSHSLQVSGVNSYRSVEHYYHDEESTTSEIP